MENKLPIGVLRVLISLYVFVFLWFMFFPDTLPDSIKWAERMEDRGYYAWLDSVIIYLSYVQVLSCVALWRPNRLAAYAYLATVLLIGVFGSVSATVSLSAIDSMMSYLQALATGATLLWLYVFNFFIKTSFQINHL